MANFADADVGCVSGELMFGAEGSAAGVAKSMGLYWSFEKSIRKLESQTGSVVGATGAFYAARRELIPRVPPGTILDDVYIPLSIARCGSRVVFESEARAWDIAPSDPSKEFQRKVRTLTGNCQLVRLAPWILSLRNPLWFRFLSHKMLRLAAPFAWLAAFCLSLLVRDKAALVVCGAQVLMLLAAGVAAMRMPLNVFTRICRVALTFVLLNAAAVVACVNFLLGRDLRWGGAAPVGPGFGDGLGALKASSDRH
jgi:cellulose synthase/poly-beta-1,6-N-acetylglucosamine synthase-like glycosyltransferase